MDTTGIIVDAKLYHPTDFYIGLGLAICSSIFIGASFIVKKKALIRLQRRGMVRASSGGFGYLKEWVWWAGLLSMGIGEAANFAAYAFAPASLVTPLGALSVLVSTILASKYLNEKLNLLGKIGCLLCILGSTILVLHSPKEGEISRLNDLLDKVKDPGYILYVSVVLICSLSIILYFGPAYGRQNIMVYTCLCSSVGSLNVMSCKALGLALKESLTGFNNGFANLFTWVCLISVILCVAVQMNYLNRLLDLFETTVVTPVYYVFFTTLVIIASTLLFREWENMTSKDILGSLCGFSTVIIAIFLLNAFKDVNIHYANIRHMFLPKRERFVSSDSQWNNRDEERLLITRMELEMELGQTSRTQRSTRIM